MANVRHISGIGSRPPLPRRTFITSAESETSGTLLERIEGRVVEKTLVATYSKVEDIEQAWIFERMFQPPVSIQASSLQLACVRFLQSIGIEGRIKVKDGSPDKNSL